MRFLFHQNIVSKIFMVDALLKYWIFIRAVETNTYYVFFFLMKGTNCSHKLRYKGCLELICKCL